jgi:hypothetical protein
MHVMYSHLHVHRVGMIYLINAVLLLSQLKERYNLEQTQNKSELLSEVSFCFIGAPTSIYLFILK